MRENRKISLLVCILLSALITGCGAGTENKLDTDKDVQNDLSVEDNIIVEQEQIESQDEQVVSNEESVTQDEIDDKKQDSNMDNEKDSSIPTSFENWNGVIPICVDDNVWGMTKEEFEQYSGVSLGVEGVEIPDGMYAYEPEKVPIYSYMQVSCQFQFSHDKIVGYSFMIQGYPGNPPIVQNIAEILYDNYGENYFSYCLGESRTLHFYWRSENGIVLLESMFEGTTCSLQYWKAEDSNEWPVGEGLNEAYTDTLRSTDKTKLSDCFYRIGFDSVAENSLEDATEAINKYLEFVEYTNIKDVYGIQSMSHQFAEFNIDYFLITDLDKDGIPDLITQQVESVKNEEFWEYYLSEYCVFTYRDGTIYHAGHVYDNIPRDLGRMYLLNDNMIFGTDHVSDCNQYFYGELDDTKLIVNKGVSQKIDLEGGKQEYIYTWNDKEISLEEAEHYFWYEGMEGTDKYIKNVSYVHIFENISENRELYRILIGAL